MNGLSLFDIQETLGRLLCSTHVVEGVINEGWLFLKPIKINLINIRQLINFETVLLPTSFFKVDSLHDQYLIASAVSHFFAGNPIIKMIKNEDTQKCIRSSTSANHISKKFRSIATKRNVRKDKTNDHRITEFSSNKKQVFGFAFSELLHPLIGIHLWQKWNSYYLCWQ